MPARGFHVIVPRSTAPCDMRGVSPVQSCRTTLTSERLIVSPSLAAMNSRFLNRFMKKSTRERVAPVIWASVCGGVSLSVQKGTAGREPGRHRSFDRVA